MVNNILEIFLELILELILSGGVDSPVEFWYYRFSKLALEEKYNTSMDPYYFFLLHLV